MEMQLKLEITPAHIYKFDQRARTMSNHEIHYNLNIINHSLTLSFSNSFSLSASLFSCSAVFSVSFSLPSLASGLKLTRQGRIVLNNYFPKKKIKYN